MFASVSLLPKASQHGSLTVTGPYRVPGCLAVLYPRSLTSSSEGALPRGVDDPRTAICQWMRLISEQLRSSPQVTELTHGGSRSSAPVLPRPSQGALPHSQGPRAKALEPDWSRSTFQF